MRDSKYQFPNKTVDPTNPMAVKAMLKKEPFFTEINSSLLYNYFFLREFISEVIKLDTDENIIISGSNAFPTYDEPFRIPTDLDLQALNRDKALQLIMDTINTVNSKNEGFKLKISDTIGETSNNILQFRADAELYGLRSCFLVDIVPDFEQMNSQKSLLRKIISTDEEFVISVPSFPTMISKKMLSILNKASGPDRHFYRTKDFYDLYMLLKNKNISIASIDKTLNQEISQQIKKNPKYDRYILANTRETLPKLTETFEILWGKMSQRLEVPKDINPLKVREFGINLINEINL